MRFPEFLTPAERRLAGLLFVLSLLGFLTRGAERLDPRVTAWIERELEPAPAPPDSAAPGGPPVAAVEGMEAPEAPPSPVGEPAIDPRVTAAASGDLDPNRATAAELETLPGIGPALAARIVADRQRNGPYRSAADLLRVPGIGPATLAKIASRLVLAPARGAGG